MRVRAHLILEAGVVLISLHLRQRVVAYEVGQEAIEVYEKGDEVEHDANEHVPHMPLQLTQAMNFRGVEHPCTQVNIIITCFKFTLSTFC